MNAQELIGKWENKKGAPSYKISAFPVNPSLNEVYIAGYAVARKEILDDLKQLDEPKKVILPKSADEFIKEGLSMGADKIAIIGSAVSFSSARPKDEFSLWFETNGELLIDALANGYEVEKEPLYYVKLPEIGYMRFGFCIPITESIEEAKKYTEQEIKAIDDRYWSFAVKVEEA